MILVDTSVWVELLNGRLGEQLSEDDLVQFVTCGPVLQEVLQGLRAENGSGMFREHFLSIPRLSDPLPADTFLEAADIYRQGRRKGYTIRSSTDCLISAIAIRYQVPVWHRDRDFRTIARFTTLQATERFPE
jgi:hypothetical protein